MQILYNIKLYLAWYWANTFKGYSDDAMADKTRYETNFNRIGSPAELIKMNFLMDDAQILSTKPKSVSEQ